jgi:hypothetical protein
MRWYFGSELVICFLSNMFSSAAADSARNHSHRLGAAYAHPSRFPLLGRQWALRAGLRRPPQQQAAHAVPPTGKRAKYGEHAPQLRVAQPLLRAAVRAITLCASGTRLPGSPARP